MIEPELSTLYPPGARPVSDVTPVSVWRLLVQWIAELTDAQLTGLVATVAFLLSAWPLLLVELPPLQDLPNHLATAHVIEHPELFPQFTFSGFFKSSSLLALWFHLLGDQRLFLAARLFAALSIAVNALALPAFFLHFRGRRAMPVCMLFAWPLVHGFFVSMGFLNFVVSFGSSLLLFIVIDRQQKQPTWRRGAGMGLLACFIWYAHPFPLLVVAALAVCAVLQRPGWRTRDLTALLPLVPAGLLFLATAHESLAAAPGAVTVLAPVLSYQSVLELVTHLWRDASGALTRWGSMSLVPALLLPVFAWRGRHSPRRLFSGAAIIALLVAYGALPVTTSNWCYLNCRLVPFIWVGLALCVPSTLPRRLPAVLLACAVSFSAVLGLDYARLDADRAEFTAGVNAVPRGATLMPLVFASKKTADFVASLGHAWGYYTTEKDAMAPLVFPAEPTSPTPWAPSPSRQSVAPTFEQFAERYATPARVCKALGQPAVDAFCTAAWRDVWDGFWKEVQPRFTHLLTWAMPAEARGLIPPAYRLTFAAGDLEIYAREPAAGASDQLTSVR